MSWLDSWLDENTVLPILFSNYQRVGDILRVLVILGAGMVIGVAIRWIVAVWRTNQLYRAYAMSAIVFYSLSALATEASRIGQDVSWRLLSNIAGLVFSWLYLKYLGRDPIARQVLMTKENKHGSE